MAWLRTVTTLASGVVFCASAHAQTLGGVVRDAASHHPVAGAVVQLIDSAGRVVTRRLTDSSGMYQLTLAGRSARIDVRRMGFRPFEKTLPPLRENATLDVALIRLATLLEAVRVSDQPSCPRRRDRAAALALWQQARTGLLASVASADATPADMRVLQFQRWMSGAGDRISEQYVQLLRRRAAVSFEAPFAAPRFLTTGFITTSASGRKQYHAPDALTLLDERFAVAHCFQLARDRDRPGQLGLAFEPASPPPDIISIRGTLWVDTIARRLRDLEYRYLVADEDVRRLNPGGRLSFVEMPNGVTLIDRWHVRMVEERALMTMQPPASSSSMERIGNASTIASPSQVTVSGGELARVTWGQQSQWHAPLGRLRARLVDRERRPVAGAALRLTNTDYVGSSDSAGVVSLDELLPGPYTIEVLDSTLASIGLALKSVDRFEAERDREMRVDIQVESATDRVTRMCKDDGIWSRTSALLIARVYSRGVPLSRAAWELPNHRGTTGADGVLVACDGLEIGERIPLRIHLAPDSVVTFPLTLRRLLTVERVDIQDARK